MQHEPIRILIADAREATLFEARHVSSPTPTSAQSLTTPKGEIRLEELRSIANTHEAEHEHHRPSLIGGAERRGGGGATHAAAHAAPHAVAPGHDVDESHRRFAKEVGAWFERVAAESLRGAVGGRPIVFAPARFLGVLRTSFGDHGLQADWHEGEYANLLPHQLVGHPTIQRALEAAMRHR